MKSPLVVSLNPAIDAEWKVDHVRWEEKNVVQSIRRWAGGKGANVARWLNYLDQNPCLLLPSGGEDGRELAAELKEERIRTRVVSIGETTRVNVVVTGDDGRQMRFNPQGPKLTRAEWKHIFQSVEKLSSRSNVLILSGGLPRGASDRTYARLVSTTRRTRVKAVLDCDGKPLVTGVRAKPFLVKPNEYELLQWAGEKSDSEQVILKAARKMAKQSQGWVLVSRGPKGAILVNDVTGHAVRAGAPAVRVLNTVGAGDALLATACWKITAEAPPDEWLRWAVAAGTAATQVQGGHLPRWELVKRFYKKIKVSRL